tara:strand:+ start:6450 stop:8024 length:1575 start_codon:yes stop_codon:yes gene_type:complete
MNGIDVMYLNLPRDVAKRAAMEEQFRGTPVRLHRIEPIPLDTLRLSFPERHQNAGSGSWMDHMRGIYSKQEVSIIMSYKKALRHALDRGLAPPFVVLDDDVRANASQVVRVLAHDVRHAPRSWEVLQFIVNNALARKQLCKMCELFVPWFPEFYSTAFTVIRSREVAEAIAWTPPTGHMVLDNWLFRTFVSFTHTRNVFEAVRWDGAVNGDEEDSFVHCASDSPVSKVARKTTVAAVTVTTHRDMSRFERLSLHPNVHLYVIASARHLGRPASTVRYLPWVRASGRFSKWIFFDRFVRHRAAPYDFVFFVDDDMRLDGFPWSTLIHESLTTPAQVVGIPRESEFSNTVYRMRDWQKDEARGHFVVSNGDFWRRLGSKRSHKWSRWQTKALDPENVSFVEQGVTLFRTDFARWYFEQIEPLVARMRTSRSDWGVDVMWCAAASEYSRAGRAKLIPCRMFGFPIWHTDEGTLTQHYDVERSRGFRASGDRQLAFLRSVPRYRAWMDAARGGMVAKNLRPKDMPNVR